MLANVQQTTIRPIIEATVGRGSLIYTDEYDIYARLQDWCQRRSKRRPGCRSKREPAAVMERGPYDPLPRASRLSQNAQSRRQFL
jgi:hypothetical protein